jgi:ABC-type branched-subunit amino acid transport system substrate-binding protein
MNKLMKVLGFALGANLALAGASPASAAVPEVVTVKVGSVMTLTGPGAFWHLAGGKAQIAYFKNFNQQGGLAYTEPDGSKHRFLVDLKYEDSAYDAKKAVISFGRLKDWGAQLITEDGSTPAAALVAPAARDKVPVVSLWSVHPDPDHYRDSLDSQYLLPNSPTNVDTSNGLLHLYKKYVWDVKNPGQPFKVGVIAFDNPPRRLYKEQWVKDFYAKSGIELVGVAIVPIAVTDVSIELKRLHSEGAKVILIDHIVSGSKVVLENAERLGIRKELAFITWFHSLPQFLEAPQLFDGVYHPWSLPEYFSKDRTPAQEKAAKIYIDDDPEYWTQRVDWALGTHHTLDIGLDAIKDVLQKYGYEGLTRERIRENLFRGKVVDTKLSPKYTIDPQAPFTLPYPSLYQFDAKSKSYIVLGKPVAVGPSNFQPRWNPGDDPKLVETKYYKWP